MLTAYLGGRPEIVRPDYPHGMRSVIRESFLLEAVGKSAAAATQIELLLIETQFASLLDPQKAADVMRRKMARGRWLAQMKAFDLYAKAPDNIGAESLIKLYEALEKGGVLQDTIDSEADSGDTGG